MTARCIFPLTAGGTMAEPIGAFPYARFDALAAA